jgi:hypothetical protein
LLSIIIEVFLYYSPVGGTTRGPFSSAFLPDKLNSLCLEKRAFYRAISGAVFFSLSLNVYGMCTRNVHIVPVPVYPGTLPYRSVATVVGYRKVFVIRPAIGFPV